MRILPFVPSLCLFGMAILFLLFGFGAKKKAARFEAEGQSFAGTITRTEIQSGSKGKKRYVVWVTWGEGAQVRTDDSFVVTKQFFQGKVGADGVVADPAVTIRALPGDPDSAILVGGTSDLGGMEWLGLLVGVIGIWQLMRTILSLRRVRA